MAPQLGDGSEGAWNAQSFAKEVIVPWEFENKRFLRDCAAGRQWETAVRLADLIRGAAAAPRNPEALGRVADLRAADATLPNHEGARNDQRVNCGKLIAPG